MNKKVNELIPKALKALEDSQVVVNRKFDKEYKGYISSMGASIIQSGLIATLAFYSSPTSEAGEKRTKLLDAILMLIENNTQGRLLDYVLAYTNVGQNKTKIDKYEKKISDALIALKLALRTFKQKE